MKLPPLSNLGNFFPKIRAQDDKPDGDRPFRVVQIEVTSRCETGCVFCPHDALSGSWVEGDLPLDLYREKIVPDLNLFDLVYLQGWGEPMLHPHLWDMLRMAQEMGCQTGFTTNGAYLQDDQNKRLVAMGVDMISVSFAGTASSVHESLRTNSEFSKLCKNFESLANLKRQLGIEKPWLELHFLMTTANLSEFPSLVELAASLGADEIVATNLTYSPNLTLDRMHAFGDQPRTENLEIINQAEQAARRLNIPLRVYPLQAEPQTMICDADPINAVYINHRGEVTPCVYLGLTMQDQVPRFYQGEAHPFDTLSFGNVCDGIVQALQSEAREGFTTAFKERNVDNSPLAMFSYLSNQHEEEEELSLPPVPCRHCYKMLGV